VSKEAESYNPSTDPEFTKLRIKMERVGRANDILRDEQFHAMRPVERERNDAMAELMRYAASKGWCGCCMKPKAECECVVVGSSTE
jgi:hypothetical protein